MGLVFCLVLSMTATVLTSLPLTFIILKLTVLMFNDIFLTKICMHLVNVKATVF